jgi:hypothetical protein
MESGSGTAALQGSAACAHEARRTQTCGSQTHPPATEHSKRETEEGRVGGNKGETAVSHKYQPTTIGESAPRIAQTTSNPNQHTTTDCTSFTSVRSIYPLHPLLPSVHDPIQGVPTGSAEREKQNKQKRRGETTWKGNARAGQMLPTRPDTLKSNSAWPPGSPGRP